MDSLQCLRPVDLRAVVATYRDALRAHQEAINRLNVYPVPDGDTGTNMALTVEAVVAELDGTDDMPGTCTAIAHGSLMGARGNSGVILCQVLRGLCDVWKGTEAVDAATLAESLRSASDAAYRAVMHPVEGTILTVAAAAADGAAGAAAGATGLAEVVRAARATADAALQRTPELLPVLKEAGVIDAGGVGFVLLLDAFLHVVAGEAVPAPSVQHDAAAVVADAATARSHGAHGAAGGPVGPRYEVMYLLEAPDEAIPVLKEAWEAIGDSIVVVGGDGEWNCHVHADDVGAAIEAALDAGGRPRRIRVTDLEGQVEEQRWVREHGVTGDAEPEPAPTPSCTAVVAVASGEGVTGIFRSLGVARVVAGGQSMNPSTAEILAAVEAAPADQVVVLPNNSNIIPVAEQVGALTAKEVRVVPTRGVAQGIAALLEFDARADAEANAGAMAGAARRVVAGEVTRAVRASSSSAGPIAAGDWLGLSDDGIEVVAPTATAAATGLLDTLVGDDHELVTVLAGADADPADTAAVREWLADNRPGVVVEFHDGGQPLYPFLFSIE